jgi:ADP-ribosyl-[dinitrogen reductase] hydrolase
MKTRTSNTHPLEISSLNIDGVRGQIGLTLCPGKKGPSTAGDYMWNRDLEADTRTVAEWGADLWLCLMEPNEMQQAGVAALPASAAGVARYLNLPIRDLNAPGKRFESAWNTVGPLVHETLKAGGKVLIHCRGGVGRAGTVAARILVESGKEPALAINAVRAVRKGAIETRHQVSYVEGLNKMRGIANSKKPLASVPTDSSHKKRADRACGGLLGLLTADALGVPHEFKSATDIPPVDQIEMVMPGNYQRSYRHVPYGTWSDDGAQTLCLLESLLEKGELDLNDLGTRLVNWWQTGHMAVDGKVFDIGNQTLQALSRLQAGTSPIKAGACHSSMIGNGSLMRVLGLALWHKGPIDALFRDAMRQSMVTHGPLEAQLCCALYCGVANGLQNGLQMGEAWSAAEAALRDHCSPDPDKSQVLKDKILKSPYRTTPTSTGYVVDALWSARACLREGDYASVVRAAVALGNDTDTTAAIAGGLAGIVFTTGGIPDRWLTALRGQDLVNPFVEALRKRHDEPTNSPPRKKKRHSNELLRETLAQHGIGPRQHFRNLSVYPLITTSEGSTKYSLLDEAINQGSARVTEITEDGHVPELAFVNTSSKPVLLIDGQELRGARQNRTLNITILARPESELVIPVACVERGRWTYSERHLEASENMLFSSARAARARAVSESMRRQTGAHADQQELWNMIDTQLRSSKRASETDAMADLYDCHGARLAAYRQAFTWLPNQAGAVFAIDGSPVAVELFDSPVTFQKQLDKVVRSFALDAAGTVRPNETEPQPRAIQALLEQVSSTNCEMFNAIGEGEDMRLASNQIAGGALVVEDRVVHLSAFTLKH